MKKMPVITALFMLSASAAALVFADDAVTVTAPAPWVTLRTDSLIVSVQADVDRLPKKEIAFKALKKSNGRASALFSKTVKVEEASSDIFLGRLRDMPLGGADFVSLEWSVPGSDIKGVIEPIGAVRLPEGAAAPAPLSAAKLKEGLSDGQIADVLAGISGSELGGAKFAAGWNSEAFFLRVTAADNVREIRFAVDAKCGKSAFLAWADKFIVYDADSDEVRGVHYKRSVDGNAIRYQDMAWGKGGALTLAKSETSRIIKVRWYEIGMQPFEERNIGFAAFITNSSKKTHSYPAAANSEIPGTWGDIKLEK